MELEDYAEFDPSIPKYKPFLIKKITFLIIIMFIIEILSNALQDNKAIITLGAKSIPEITNGEYWRFLTCVFLHGNIFHLMLNLGGLYIFGKEVESIYGTFRFFLIFIFSAWGAGLTSYIFSDGIAIGASGAIFGILGSLIVFFYKQKEKITGANIKFRSMYTVAIINIVLGFLLPRIDNSAHVGGLVAGLIISWFLSPEYRIEKDDSLNKVYITRKKNIQKALTGIVLTLLILYLLTYFAISIK